MCIQPRIYIYQQKAIEEPPFEISHQSLDHVSHPNLLIWINQIKITLIHATSRWYIGHNSAVSSPILELFGSNETLMDPIHPA